MRPLPLLLLFEIMLETALEKFPCRTELEDGTPCSIRPMAAQDEQAFREFHAVIPEREQLFIRSEIKDGTLFHKWIDRPDFGKTLPLLAFVDGNLVAMVTLHQRLGGWKRHIGKVYFLTHPDYHGRGLITELLTLIIDLAKHCGLTKLESEFNGERAVAIEAMGTAGFEELVRLPRYIQDMQSHKHDYVLMGMNLVASFDNLGAGD